MDKAKVRDQLASYRVISPEGMETSSFGKGKPGKLKSRKRCISIRLDLEILEHFKSGGSGWQSRINAALSDYVADQNVTK